MKKRFLIWMAALLGAVSLHAQPQVIDCQCLRTQAVLNVTNCMAVVPDLCLFTQCLISTVQPPPPVTCSQSPTAGTPVGPGITMITVTVISSIGVVEQCVIPFTVVAPNNGPFALLCAPNKTVECGTTWTFNQPTPTNYCCPQAGTPGNGVTPISMTTTTNGTCPQVITRTWTVRDNCGVIASCSQIVTVVDTTPPVLPCTCLTSGNAAFPPIPLTVTNCSDVIPDFCQIALFCATDNCGPLTCTQSPPAGTIVGPGIHPITVSVRDCAGNIASCQLNFTVVAPATGPFALLCAPNKTVECGTTWTFNPPTPTNYCCPPQGTTGNGVTLISVTTTTNGSCPQVFTRTWTMRDGCGVIASCSQIVTVVDTTPPVLNCQCLQNNPLFPLTVTGCSNVVPDFCLLLSACATDICGPLTCSQSPVAGTIVFPGVHPITVTVTDCAGNMASCTVNFTVVAPPGGCCLNPPGGMVAWWPLDEITGATIFADATGNGHTAIVESGGPVGSPGSPFAVGGVVAGANYFYGVSPRGRAVNAPLLNFGTGSFSADCWVNPVPTGVIHWHPIVDKLNQTGSTTGFGYTVGLLNQRVVLKVGDGTIYTYTSVGTVPYSAWSFVAVVVNRTANTVTFHLNGVTEAPQALSPAGNFNSTFDVLIGSTWNNNLPLGELAVDELELFNLPLATTVLNDLWSANSSGKCKTNTCVVSIFCPTNLIDTASCTQACAVVNYPAPLVANGVLTGCAPPSGTCFPIGVNTVTCTAASPCGPPATCSFTVTVNAPTNCCVSQTNFWNSGMGGGVALAPSTPDPNYVLVSAPPGGCTGPAQVLLPSSLPVGPWVANGPNSQWIGAGPTANCQEGVYHYRLCFYLPCTDGASIIGQWAVDDNAAMYLNGQPTGNTIPSTQYPNLPGYGWFPVSITNGFVCGTNCLDFYVTNANIGINPTGFRAELTNVFDDCCCGPLQDTSSYHSGVNAGGPIPQLSLDPQLVVTCAPAGAPTGPAQVTFVNPNWMPNGPDSQWLAPVGNPNLPGGLYCYSYRFNLPPCTNGIPNYAVKGQWMGDDAGTIYVNGIPSGNDLPNGWAFTNWHPISITSGLMPGLNTLTFYVTNASAGDTGIRVELTNYASCCDCTNIACVVSITCPPDLTQLTCLNGAVVNYVAPVASSTCGPITSLVCVPPSGSFFPLASTLVTCTATDGGANSASCSFAVTVALDPNCCTITPVLSLFSGANSSGVLPGGVMDPQFRTGPPLFTSPNPWVPTPIVGSWVPNSAISKWVSPKANMSSAPGGVYVYTNRFFLCSTNQAAITGRWTADNSGSIRLNGAATPNFLPPNIAFQSWYPVSITSGFVPGWNTLTFHVTNNTTSLTGLRTEITGSACCNSCVTIACPVNKTTNICTTGVVVNYPAPAANSACAQLTSVSCTPASGSVFPLGVNTVTCTAVDALGNAAKCSFNVTVQSASLPVIIMCPPNQTILVCSNSAKAYYKVKATGQVGPVICTPPSGSTFAVGTNNVVCFATNACGQGWACSFLIIVKNHLLGAPDATITAGIPDNFVLPAEASPQSACVVTAFGGFPSWKGFDVVACDTLFGHRFTGLPNNIAKAELVVRMKPTSDPDSSNDGLFVGLPVCLPGNFRYVATISTLPGAGGTWNPGKAAVTFTRNLGVLNPLILSDMNTQGYLDVVVHDDTTVDYMQLRIWRCPPPQPGIGVPYDMVGGATAALRPIGGTGIGISPKPAICVFPNPNVLSGISLQPGGAKALTFTTVIDFEAPEGAGIDIVLPPDPRNTNGMPYLSFRSKGAKGYCVKTAKLYDDEPDIAYRSSAIGTNGDLFPSFTWDAANIETNVLLWLNRLPGVTGVVMTVTIDLATREATLEFPDCLWTADHGRKGWDGCIYGNGTPSKGTNKTARLILGPRPPHIPMGGITEMSLLSTGLSEFLVEDPEITAMGRRWGDGHVTLMKAYDDGEKISFVSHGEGGGVHTDLGHASSFSIGIHHVEDGEMPEQEQLFLMRGVNPFPTGLTNRPPPPTIPLRLAKIPGGVACSVDFSDLAAESITVQLWSNGVLIAQGSGPGSAIEPESPLILDRWPDRLTQVSVNGELRLTCGELMTISGIQGDEIRIIPELPQGVELPAYIGSLECLVSEGMDSVLFGLQTTLACPPDAVIHIARSTDGVALTWDCDGYLLQGAEEVTGPWFDLGVESPASMSTNRPWRFFRLRGR